MFYKINGSAGYGKTHSLIEKVESLYDYTQTEQSFVLITPTNKAAMVLNSRLREKGLPNLAKTLHSTLYRWKQSTKLLRTKLVRRIDPTTSKFEVDSKGKPVYHEEEEYKFIAEIRKELRGKVVVIDESSMVNSSVWYDLFECGLFEEIHAYGDEKQLPPIERYQDLSTEHKRYYQFWHQLTATTTLMHNFRQSGDLKDFLEVVEKSIMPGRYQPGIPVPLSIGENYSIHANCMTESDLLGEMMRADIIITPYNKVRQLCNNICRKENARRSKKRYVEVPVVGDKFILTDGIKREGGDGRNKFKYVYLAKNVCGVITKIHEVDLVDNLIIVDFVDETGIEHTAEILSIAKIMGGALNTDYAKIDYAYAVTAHSAQGGQWPDVLFLDSHFPSDLDKLRYVSITRASKRISIVTGITNATEGSDADKSILIRIANYKD